MSTTELEQRMEHLEHEVCEIKKLLRQPRAKRDRKSWLRTVGIFKDDPGFQEIVRLGREYRESQPFPEDL